MKRHMKKHITDLLKDESGQGTTEYILIIVALIGLAVVFRDNIKTVVQSRISQFGDTLKGFTP